MRLARRVSLTRRRMLSWRFKSALLSYAFCLLIGWLVCSFSDWLCIVSLLWSHFLFWFRLSGLLSRTRNLDVNWSWWQTCRKKDRSLCGGSVELEVCWFVSFCSLKLLHLIFDVFLNSSSHTHSLWALLQDCCGTEWTSSQWSTLATMTLSLMRMSICNVCVVLFVCVSFF